VKGVLLLAAGVVIAFAGSVSSLANTAAWWGLALLIVGAFLAIIGFLVLIDHWPGLRRR
jgi:uncharacterized membrane protein HdeD (DUF308 family)